MADSRPAVRYLAALYLGTNRYDGQLRMTDMTVVSEDTGRMLENLGWWVFPDPADETARDIFDMKEADEQKWTRLFNRRRHD